MAILNQKNDGFVKWIGWYGDCDVESDCSEIDLNAYKDIIHSVYQFTLDGTGSRTWSSLNPSFLNSFSNLECGHAYTIVLKKGDGSIVLPHFRISAFESGDYGTLIQSCDGNEDPESCCYNFNTSVTDSNDLNGVSLQLEQTSGGTLCFNSLNDIPGDSTETFHCVDESENFMFNVALTLKDGLNAIENKIFKYTAVDGCCYEADFTGFNDLQFPGPVFIKIGCIEPKTPTPTPVATPTPTPSGEIPFDQLTIEFEQSPQEVRIPVSFTGQIVQVNLSGGFYGIELSMVDSGTKYVPINIQDDSDLSGNVGKKIIVRNGFARNDLPGIEMWGTYIYLVDYEIVDEPRVTPTPTPAPPTPTPVPTPTPTPLECCNEFNTTITENNDLKGVSLQLEQTSGGTLCFNSLNDIPGDSTETFHCVDESENFMFNVGLTLKDGLNAIENKIFKYTAVDGCCYEADFTGFNDLQFPGPVFIKIG